MGDFRKLDVWRKAHAMALSAHRVAGKMRRRELTSLRSQLVRAAMSVPANIVEGRAQRTDREFARFLRIALASATEFEYHLLMASDIAAIGHNDFGSLMGEVIDVKKMLTGLLDRVEAEKPVPAVKADS